MTNIIGKMTLSKKYHHGPERGGCSIKRLSTKDLIAETIVELLQTKTIEDITVTEIAQEVGITTRTFYRYYKDKFDVCNDVYSRILETKCWYHDGKRCNLYQFFENICRMISTDYAKFFENTMCYHGQNSIHEHIVAYGVQDLVNQLKYTGHGDLVTEETIPQMEFFMYGLDNILTCSMNHKGKKDIFLNIYDKTKFLPKDISDALSAEPVYAPELPPNSEKSR